jgi:hypothetical protein
LLETRRDVHRVADGGEVEALAQPMRTDDGWAVVDADTNAQLGEPR